MHKLQYSTREYDFASIIKDWLDIYDLEKLHDIKKYEIFSREQDQSTRWHKVYYDSFRRDATFQDLYESFLKGIIKPRYNGEQIVYQKVPTFRVHLAGNLAVGEYHKDKFYREKEWAELVNEMNYYLPFTNTNENNTIWAESEEDKRDFSPMLLKYGECMEWDGSNLMHGNKVNDSDKTRVSVDFRVMPESTYVDSNHTTINTSVPFSIGGYYEIL